jgi:hypothetical protein
MDKSNLWFCGSALGISREKQFDQDVGHSLGMFAKRVEFRIRQVSGLIAK